MKLKIVLVFALFLSILSFQNCGQDLSVLSDDSDPSPVVKRDSSSGLDTNVKENKAAEIVSARYWRGGWFPAPNTPNWSHDMDFIFNDDSTITVKSKTTDQFCFKSDIVLDQEQRQKWEIVYSSLEVKPLDDGTPMMADGGVEVLILVFSDKSTKTIHLAHWDAGPGDLVASNGDNMIEFLQRIDSEMPHGCQ